MGPIATGFASSYLLEEGEQAFCVFMGRVVVCGIGLKCYNLAIDPPLEEVSERIGQFLNWP